MDFTALVIITILALLIVTLVILLQRSRCKRTEFLETITIPMCVVNAEGIIKKIPNRKYVIDSVINLKRAIGMDITTLITEDEDKLDIRNAINDIFSGKLQTDKKYYKIKDANNKYQEAFFYLNYYNRENIIILVNGMERRDKMSHNPMRTIQEILNLVSTPVVIQDLSEKNSTLFANKALNSIIKLPTTNIKDIDANALKVNITTKTIRIGSHNIMVGNVTKRDTDMQYIHDLLHQQMSLLESRQPVRFWQWDLSKAIITIYNGDEILTDAKPRVFEESVFIEMVRQQERPRVINKLNDIRTGATEDISMDCAYIRNNQYHHFATSGKIIERDNEGKPLIIIGIGINVNQKVALEARLRDTEKAVSHRDDTNQKLLTNISTMMDSPLNSILGYSQLLADEGDAKVRSEYLNLLQNDANTLLNKLNLMLQIANVSAGTATLIKNPVDLNGAISECVNASEKSVPNTKEVTIDIDVPEIPTTIMVDNRYLVRVLRILIDNALKYTKKGKITVGYQQNEANEVYIYVRDTGIGISKEKQSTIFDVFKSNSKYQSNNYSLNLPLCKVIIERFNGTIGFDSEENRGSTFWFTLPVGY